MANITHIKNVLPYKTRDGSRIYELMHPANEGNRNQSLALAIISPGERTKLHVHQVSEELYHVQSGTGLMTMGNEEFEIKTGDTICIRPGSPHCVENTGKNDLQILCCCAPAYDHDDTKIL